MIDLDEVDIDSVCSESEKQFSDNVAIINGKRCTFNYFFNNFLLPNRPCIIKHIDTSWPCFKTWVTCDGKPNMNFFNRYNSLVNVAQCDEKIYDVQKKIQMNLAEYLTYWKNYHTGLDDRCLYLKDWHFLKDFPQDVVYKVPEFFASDWIGEYHDNHPEIGDDYRFVYIGPKGSWTPLHMDVFSSYSWSVNVVGRKRWMLLEPGTEKHFKDKHGNLLFDKNLTADPDLGGFYEVQQESGDAIFVPSGWHHQVWNLEDTISINQNWVNGSNISWMWNSLQESLKKVQHEIEDCQDMEDWDGHCQLMLKCLYGIDFHEFYTFLAEIISSRINSIKSQEKLSVFGGWKLGMNYLRYDMESAKKILAELKDSPYIQNVDSGVESPDCLYYRLQNLLEDGT